MHKPATCALDFQVLFFVVQCIHFFLQGQKRVGPERKVVKKTTVMVSQPAGTSEPETDQSGQESHMPSWSSDHNYNAVQTEKTAAISSSVFYKSCMYLLGVFNIFVFSLQPYHMVTPNDQ